MSEIIFEKPVKTKRKFVAEDLVIKAYDDVKPYFEKLKQQAIQNEEELLQWLNNRSELETVLQEHTGWLYIRMSCDTRNEQIRNDYTFYINEIQPQVSLASNRLNEKILNSGLKRRKSI